MRALERFGVVRDRRLPELLSLVDEVHETTARNRRCEVDENGDHEERLCGGGEERRSFTAAFLTSAA